MAFPSIVTTAETAVTTAGTTHAITLPSGLLPGNLILIILDKGSTSATFNALAGWTELIDVNAANGMTVWYRQCDGTEGATVTFTSSANTRSATIAFRILGAADSTARPPEISTVATGTSVNPDATTCTPTGGAKDYLWISFAGMAGEEADDDTWGNTPPTNYLPNPPLQISCGTVGTNLGGLILAASRTANAASEDAGNFNVDSSAAWNAYTIAIHPQPQDIPATSASYEPSGSPTRMPDGPQNAHPSFRNTSSFYDAYFDNGRTYTDEMGRRTAPAAVPISAGERFNLTNKTFVPAVGAGSAFVVADELIPTPVVLPETVIVLPGTVYLSPPPAASTLFDGDPIIPPSARLRTILRHTDELSFRSQTGWFAADGPAVPASKLKQSLRHQDSITVPCSFTIPIDEPPMARLTPKGKPSPRFEDLHTAPFAPPFTVPIDVMEMLNRGSAARRTSIPEHDQRYIPPVGATPIIHSDDLPLRTFKAKPPALGPLSQASEYMRFIGNTLSMYDWSNAAPLNASRKQSAKLPIDPYIAAAATFTNWGDFFAPLRPSRSRTAPSIGEYQAVLSAFKAWSEPAIPSAQRPRRQLRATDQDFFRFIHIFAYWAKTDVVMPVRVKQRFAHYVIAEYLRFESNAGQHLWKLPSKSVDFKAGTSDPSVTFSFRDTDRTVRFTKEQ